MGLIKCPGCCVIHPQNFLRALFPGRQPGEKTEPAGQHDISFPTAVCYRMVRIVQAHWFLMVLTYIGHRLSSGLWVIHDQCQFLSFSWCEPTCQLSPVGALNMMPFLPTVFEVSDGDDKYCLSREPLAISIQSTLPPLPVLMVCQAVLQCWLHLPLLRSLKIFQTNRPSQLILYLTCIKEKINW